MTSEPDESASTRADERSELTSAQTARAEAEAAARRFAFLAEAGEVLSSSLDYEHTLREVARLAVPILGDMCIVDIVTSDGMQRVAATHISPAKSELLQDLRRRYPPDAASPQPAARVARSGQPELLAHVSPETVASRTRDEDHASLIRRLEIRSHLAVPLVARGALVGVISLGITESGRRYDERDVTFAMELARRAALAVDNARLYRVAQDELAERRRVEDALRLSEGRFRALFEQSPVSLQIFATTGECTFVNPAWERHFATSRDELSGFNLFTDPQVRALGILPIMERVLAGESVRAPTHRFDPAASGRIGRAVWQDVHQFPIRGADGTVQEIAVIALDVTEQHEARTRLEEAVTARDTFLSAASHELRTPITSMLLRLQAARRAIGRGDAGVFSPESITRLVDQLDGSVERLARLVDDLLDITRIETGKLQLNVQPGDLAVVVAEVLERLAPHLAAAHVPLTSELTAAPARFDAFRIEQVIANLITNAIRYAAGQPLTVRVETAGERVRIVVEDRGPGIAAEDRERIFDRFERLAPPRQISGLGLGLYIVRDIVRAHGGTVHVESGHVESGHVEGARGAGARFVVELPVSGPG